MIHEALTQRLIGLAIEVHKELGAGLLESTYEACYQHEMISNGISVVTQVPIPVIYKGIKIDCGYRLDMLVENLVIIENKAVETLAPIHEAQLLTHMRLAKISVGLLFNWNVTLLKDGLIRRVL